MRALHLFFELHQPYDLKVLEEGGHEYFGGGAAFRGANQKYYQPFFALLERNTQRFAGLKVSLAVSGAWLDQAELYEPDLVRRLQKLVDLKQVEIVAQPYYYSLAEFYDQEEFREQVELSRRKNEEKLGAKCQVLALPGLMYHDRLAKWAEQAGFVGALAGDATESLGFRSPNQVFDAAGCERFRVLFENGRLSRAVARGEDLVLVSILKTNEDVSEERVEEAPQEESAAGVSRKRSTAAEFVRGRAGVTQDRSTVARAGRREAAERKVYAARKFQKAIEIESLRGNLISLCLDARVLGEHREEGAVAFFDELFVNWLKVPGNKFVTASEALTEFAPTAEISVKSTVKAAELGGAKDGMAGEDDVLAAKVAAKGLARAEDVQYTLPEGVCSEKAKALQKRLYDLRERVLKTKNEDLRLDFRKLTAFDYTRDEKLAEFEKVLADFEARVVRLLPKPKRLQAENAGTEAGDGKANLTAAREDLQEAEEEPEDYTVQVHRILKRATRKVKPEERILAEMSEMAEDGAEDSEAFEVPEASEAMEHDSEEMTEAFDAAEAELQVIAQRMKRSRQTTERELEALMEAEVVEGPTLLDDADEDEEEKSSAKSERQNAKQERLGAKRKKKHRIVLD